MATNDPPDTVDAAIAAWLDAQHAGKRRDGEALLSAHPDLHVFRADYELLDQRFAPLRRITAGAPAEAALTLAADDTVVPEPPQPGTSFGDYDLLAEIARGGMGIVYKARQRSLNRIVALKMILAGGHNAQRDRQRFLVEARAVARLNHPHVVPIYEVGERDGQPYFTMELLTGGSLRERADTLRGDQRAIARLMVTIARAIEHAHRRGLLHRDLKPSNVLLDEHGQPHVTDFGLAKPLRIADCGLRIEDNNPQSTIRNPQWEESDLTQAGAIVGTPSYMAPEQATAQSELTTAVDVYGLGAVLYELLTGRPPFRENTPLETLLKVVDAEPLAPRRLVSTIHPDLETICMKCLSKEPLARYGSADALADDLERWLADRPIQARPVAARERVVKWARRQPLLASALGGVAAACLALLVLAGLLWQHAELRAAAVLSLDEAEDKRSTAERLAETIRTEVGRLEQEKAAARTELASVRREARLTRYAADIPLAHSAWQANRIERMLTILERHEPKTGAEDLRGFEWHLLRRLTDNTHLTVGTAKYRKDRESEHFHQALFGPDGKHAALLSSTRTSITLLDVATGKLGQTIALPYGRAWHIAFAADGNSLIVLQSKIVPTREQPLEKELVLSRWQVPGGEPIATEPLPVTRATGHEAVVMTPDGTRVVLVSQTELDHLVEFAIWDVQDKKLRRHLTKRSLQRQAVAIAPDGRTLAVAGDTSADHGNVFLGLLGLRAPYAICLWNLQTGAEEAVLQGHTGFILALAFSPDGKTLASGGMDRAIRVWDVAARKERATLSGHTSWVNQLAFAHDGQTLASAGSDNVIRLWHLGRGTQTNSFKGHRAAALSLSFSPDGKLLASTNGDVKLWPTLAPQPLRLNSSFVLREGISFSPDLQELVGWHDRLDTRTGKQLPRQVAEGSSRHGWPTYSPDQRILAFMRAGKPGHADAHVGHGLLLDAATWQERGQLEGKLEARVGFAFSSDSKLLAACTTEKRLALWDVSTGKVRLRFKGQPADFTSLLFSTDDKSLITASRNGLVQIWDAATGVERRRLTVAVPNRYGYGFKVFALAPDNRTLACGSIYGELLMVVDIATGKERYTLTTPSSVAGAAFSPDGRRLATWGGEPDRTGDLTLWDAETGHELLILEQPAEVTVAAFSRDGRQLGSITRDGKVTVWAATPQER